MSIADINHMASLYAQPTAFDQNAWKTAFDISNAFADNSEKHRANRENLATSDWRVANQNNGYQTGIEKNNLAVADLQRQYNNALQIDPSANQAAIAQNNYATTGAQLGEKGLLGQDEATKWIQAYGTNPDGTPRTMPEIYQAMQVDGKFIANPYAYSAFWTQMNQQRANQQAMFQSLLDNSMETTVDAMGNMVKTGNINNALFNQKLNHAVATGQLSQEQADQFRQHLFPVSPTHSVLPKGLKIGGDFASQLEALNHSPNNQVVPYQMGISPPEISIPYAVGNSPNSVINTAVVNPVDKQQQTIQHLQNWENGGSSQFWENYWNERKNQNQARERALGEAMNMMKHNQSGYPVFLQR